MRKNGNDLSLSSSPSHRGMNKTMQMATDRLGLPPKTPVTGQVRAAVFINKNKQQCDCPQQQLLSSDSLPVSRA
jgi:hypothetical protein